MAMPYSMCRMPYFIRRMPCEIWHTAYETLLRRKLEHRRRLILPAFFQDGRREVRFIRRIGKMLCLEAEAVALVIGLADFALHLCEKVADVKLHARLGRPDFHHPARRWFGDLRRLTQYSGLAVHDEVVVVAAAEFQLLVVLVDARADRRRLRKVERRAFDASQFAGRDQSRVDWCEAVGVDRQLMVQYVAVALPRQVEIGMVGQVDH